MKFMLSKETVTHFQNMLLLAGIGLPNEAFVEPLEIRESEDIYKKLLQIMRSEAIENELMNHRKVTIFLEGITIGVVEKDGTMAVGFIVPEYNKQTALIYHNGFEIYLHTTGDAEDTEELLNSVDRNNKVLEGWVENKNKILMDLIYKKENSV